MQGVPLPILLGEAIYGLVTGDAQRLRTQRLPFAKPAAFTLENILGGSDPWQPGSRLAAGG